MSPSLEIVKDRLIYEKRGHETDLTTSSSCKEEKSWADRILEQACEATGLSKEDLQQELSSGKKIVWKT